MEKRTNEKNAQIAFFFLLSGNYLLSIVRDSIGETNFSNSFLVGLTAFISLLIGSLLSSTNRQNSSSETERVSFLFLLHGSFLLFFYYFQLQQDPILFIFSGISTVLTSSLLWSVASSRELYLTKFFSSFSKAATLGQSFGSVLGWGLLQVFHEPSLLLLFSAIFVYISAYFVYLLHENEENHDEKVQKIVKKSTTSMVIKHKYRYLIIISLFQLLNSMTTSLVYLIKLESFEGFNRLETLSLTSQINIFASLSILFVQFSGLVESISPKKALLLLPITIGFAIVIMEIFGKDDFLIVCFMIISTRVTSYALTKPSRESLFSVFSNSDRISMKPFVDTFVGKIGTILAAVFHSMSFHIFVHFGLLIFWFVLTVYIGMDWEMVREDDVAEENRDNHLKKKEN